MATTTLYDMISIKLQLGDETRRLKLPLKDLVPSILPSKLRGFLNIPISKTVVFERFSDSAGAYIKLDEKNPAVYKQLYRAAKAKAKLRIKVVVIDTAEPTPIQVENISEEKEIPVLKSKTPSAQSSQTTLGPMPRLVPKPIQTPQPAKVEAETKPTVSSPLKSWTGHLTSFSVQCNSCGDTIPGVHYHCDICDDNDFDLCAKCVDNGNHCDVDEHFLIKRTVVNGKISNSTTYKVAKKAAPPTVIKEMPKEMSKEMPGAFVPEPVAKKDVESSRTCNNCITSLPEKAFIHCNDCEDYDLCKDCFVNDKHGHHPAHQFSTVAPELARVYGVGVKLTAGRGMRHFATCDGCDKNIVGVRHKCLNCPDWDYCSTCFLSARHIHPGHRFAPIYQHIGLGDEHKPVHSFIRCDGPLCKNKSSYIHGDRYKCAVCPDTDFCGNCEALPTNEHCRTHPLIKLRTPVNHVSVTTFGENGDGEIMSTMGDRPPQKTQKTSKSTETVATKSANAATQVQTIAEIKPASPLIEAAVPAPVEEEKIVPESPQVQLQAWFVSDSLVDGSVVEPDTLYTQTWTLRNPGPLVWPAGTTVRYTGGDNMLNINAQQPASFQEIEAAVSSNTHPYEVKANEEIRYSVTIKTPKTPGKSISYWRLKTPQGQPFGHKLWVDVKVAEKKPEVEVLKFVPEVAKEEPEAEIKEEIKEEEPLATSQMIFPTLPKESPISSVMASEPEKNESLAGDDVEFLDDLEHLAISDDDATSDDAFLTDEEYEMLDTDSAIEEAVNGKKK